MTFGPCTGGGFVYRTDEELVDAIARLIAAPGLRTDLGERGYAAFLELWCRDAHMARYFGLLDDTSRQKLGRPLGGR